MLTEKKDYCERLMIINPYEVLLYIHIGSVKSYTERLKELSNHSSYKKNDMNKYIKEFSRREGDTRCGCAGKIGNHQHLTIFINLERFKRNPGSIIPTFAHEVFHTISYIADGVGLCYGEDCAYLMSYIMEKNLDMIDETDNFIASISEH